MKSPSRPYQFLRVTSLSVIGSLVKSDDPQVFKYLIKTDLLPLTLIIVEKGAPIEKQVAMFVLQKLLSTQEGILHVCNNSKRFVLLTSVLTKLCTLLLSEYSQPILKHVLVLYTRLAQYDRARMALNKLLPQALRPLKPSTDTDQALLKFQQRITGDDSLAPIWKKLVQILSTSSPNFQKNTNQPHIPQRPLPIGPQSDHIKQQSLPPHGHQSHLVPNAHRATHNNKIGSFRGPRQFNQVSNFVPQRIVSNQVSQTMAPINPQNHIYQPPHNQGPPNKMLHSPYKPPFATQQQSIPQSTSFPHFGNKANNPSNNGNSNTSSWRGPSS